MRKLLFISILLVGCTAEDLDDCGCKNIPYELENESGIVRLNTCTAKGITELKYVSDNALRIWVKNHGCE